MARDEAGPFARGETFYNGGDIDTANLGGTNYEGKEFTLEVNTPNGQDAGDPSGRKVRVKVVRNVSGVALKPGRLAHFSAASTAPLECRVDGYTILPADRPAGVVDEFLPAAGVPNNDLFYLVIEGPTTVVQGATTQGNLVIGSRLVPTAFGATAGDDLGGRAGLQTLAAGTDAATTAALAAQLQNHFGFAGAANNTAGATVASVVRFR